MLAEQESGSTQSLQADTAWLDNKANTISSLETY